MVIGGYRRTGDLIGVASVVAGLVMSEFIASLNNGLNNPIVSIGNRIVDHVPAGAKEFAIRTFGTNDKSALVITISVIVIFISAFVGRSYFGGNSKRAILMLGGLTAIGALAALLDAGSNFFSILPSLVAGGITLLVLRWFDRISNQTESDEKEWSRRDLFKSLAIVGAGAILASSAGKFLRTHSISQLQRLNVILPKPLKFLPAPPIDPALTTPGLSNLFTPNAEFYRIDTAIVLPNISVDSWRLKIFGLVANPLEFTYQELTSRPTFELDDTIACVSNEVGGGLVGNARWQGIRLDDLIREASPNRTADQIMGYSSDGFSAGFPLAALDGRDAMIAIGMNGEVLPQAHGFPARIIVPGLYGYVSATKWLTQIEVTRFDKRQGYWIPRGWSAQAPIKTASRIDTPREGETIKKGKIAIAGVAWAPTRGISRVEVRINNDPWRDATLGPALAKTTWRQWWIEWSPLTGTSAISVRATDGTGARQSRVEVPAQPDGAEGWHTIKVTVA